MKYAVTIPPASEPVTLQEAKEHLRVTGSDEDTLISALISAARVKAEEECGYAIVTQTLSAWWDKWPTDNTFGLPIYPAAAVSDIRYKDEEGNVQLLPDSEYTTDLVGMTPRIVLNPDADVPTVGQYPNAVEVRYIAGKDVADVDEATKIGIKLWLTLLYEHREDMKINDNVPGVRSGAWIFATKRNNLI
jgi:uncharacterized phiE125 gp8 family phage protein